MFTSVSARWASRGVLLLDDRLETHRRDPRTMRPKPAGFGLCSVPSTQAVAPASNSANRAVTESAWVSGESPVTISTGPWCAASCVAAHLHGVPGPQLLGLLDELQIVPGRRSASRTRSLR